MYTAFPIDWQNNKVIIGQPSIMIIWAHQNGGRHSSTGGRVIKTANYTATIKQISSPTEGLFDICFPQVHLWLGPQPNGFEKNS